MLVLTKGDSGKALALIKRPRAENIGHEKHR